MRTVLLTVAITVVVNSLIASHQPAAQQPPAVSGSERRHIVTGPALESATQNMAIIRWTANTAGGTVVHYGIVRYGTAPTSLNHIAKSPIRWNRSQPNVTYRVRIDGLTSGTTYYYTVDSAQADGIGLGLKSSVNQFTTRSRP